MKIPLLALFGAVLLAGERPARLAAAAITLSNEQVAATWTIRHHTLRPDSLRDRQTGQTLALRGELFALGLTNGDFIHAGDFRLVGPVRTEPLVANPGASRLVERLPGRQFVAELAGADGNLHVTWRAILRDGSRYLRQEFVFTAAKREVPLNVIRLWDTPLAGAHATGTVAGCPVATETVFLGIEHPLSLNQAESGRVRCLLPRGAPLCAGESYTCSSVAGFADPGQLRRGLLAYLERERPRPYQPFLHYNSWYDLGYGNKYDEKAALNVIHALGDELVVQRGVRLDSFLFDDGWDDNATLWQFHSGFPDGFAAVRSAAAKYGAAPGIWLSPWGGYGQAHDERLKFGREQGFEIRNHNFSLAGPKYYERFRSLCVNVVTNYGINQFKFDGIGANSTADPGAQRDFDAMLKLIGELRALKPDLYINQTTGTWPSPFWLLFADSIWRGGADHSFVAGRAPARERWITYRDNEVYDNVVRRSRLFPLNSLMLHGIIFARDAHGLNDDTNGIFKSEVRSFFGSGTQLQELYITPALLTPSDWDTLAEAANWSRANAGTLVDTHWIGGRPADGQVYGWAAWSPWKGILTLRNPAAQPAAIQIDAAKVFELPPAAPQNFNLVSPFKDQHLELKTLRAGQPATFQLEPFEVLVVEAFPAVN